VDFPTDDFPKETAERLEVMARCDRYQHALSVKDQLLWMALKEKEKAEEELQQERQLSSAYAEEMAQWADLAQSLKHQLAESQRETETIAQENARLVELLRQNKIYFTR
jgi:hypothetical protein